MSTYKESHTLGPWTILTEGDKDSCILRTVMGPGNRPRNLSEVALITTGSYSDEVEEANVKLIAAAPELLFQVQQAKTILEVIDPENPAIQQMEIIIKKATE